MVAVRPATTTQISKACDASHRYFTSNRLVDDHAPGAPAAPLARTRDRPHLGYCTFADTLALLAQRERAGPSLVAMVERAPLADEVSDAVVHLKWPMANVD